MSAKTLAEIKRNGWVLTGSGKIWLSGPGEIVTLTEARRRLRGWKAKVRYADANDDGSDDEY